MGRPIIVRTVGVNSAGVVILIQRGPSAQHLLRLSCVKSIVSSYLAKLLYDQISYSMKDG